MSEDEKSDKANAYELALLSSTSHRITSSSSTSEPILKTVMAASKQQLARRKDTGVHSSSSLSLSSIYIDSNGDMSNIAALDDPHLFQHASHNELLCAFCACNEQAVLAQGLLEKHATSNMANSLNPNELIASIRNLNFVNNKLSNKEIISDEDIKKYSIVFSY
jgi:hypothetical protein